MKRILVAAAVLFIIFGAAVFANPQGAVAGVYEGEIEVPGSPIRVIIEVTSGGGGKLAATISIPQQGARNLPLDNVNINNELFSFKLPGVPGDPRFEGRIAAETRKIEGTFFQGGGSYPLKLRPADEVAAESAKSLEDIDKLAQEALGKFEVPGLAIAVVQGKKIIYIKGFGQRDAEKSLPVTPDTLFAIGSCTKAFTTFVLGQLVDEGKISWDKPVNQYIPWFKLYDSSLTSRLTVRDAVTHRSGLPRHDLLWYNNNESTRESLVRKVAFLQPSADLREKWQYNNLMFLTAGYLIETVTGKSWEDNVRERIFKPLAMSRANFSVSETQKDSDFAQPFEKREEKIVKVPFRAANLIGPAGSINCSVREMANWIMLHLGSGEFGDARTIESSTLEEIHRSQMTTGIQSERPDILGGGYALGWFVDSYRGHLRVEHGGNIDGFSAALQLFPKDGFGIVILTNRGATPVGEMLSRTIADRLLKLPSVDWLGDAAKQGKAVEDALKEGEKRKESARVAGTSPSHAIADFAGDYEHPGYGLLKINIADGKLEAVYNGIHTPLEHWHYDIFSGVKGADPTFANVKFQFHMDLNGNISKVSSLLESSVDAIVFNKKADARYLDPAFLARFTGDYELLGRTLSISVKGNSLIAKFTGQPVVELVPVPGDLFTLKEDHDVVIKFIADASDATKILSLEFRQSGVVLNAPRKVK